MPQHRRRSRRPQPYAIYPSGVSQELRRDGGSFPDNPEALATTVEIADKVETYSLSHKAFMPNFPLPEDFVIDTEQLKTVYKNSFANTVSAVKDEEEKERLGACLERINGAIDACGSIEEVDAVSQADYVDPAFDAQVKLTTAKQFTYLYHLAYEGRANGGATIFRNRR